MIILQQNNVPNAFQRNRFTAHMSDSCGNVFVYGTLMSSMVFGALISRTPKCFPGLLYGFRRHAIEGRPYPGITEDDNSSVSGLLVTGLSGEELDVLDFFEDEEYERRKVQVHNAAFVSMGMQMKSRYYRHRAAAADV
mmetsp:Transcript_11192/g.31139  ORF Transcript_11192/g.31139 Transcript_11192/m.31139 type:complete len:138 (-) Transcript_11192:33-446(-)